MNEDEKVEQHPTYMDNPAAVGAPKNWPWGYLPCGCRNDGFGQHMRRGLA